MYFVYILLSVNFKKTYVGHTDDVIKRLQEHNAGKSIYTRRYKPWKVIYSENFKTEIEAIKREKYFKSGAGRRWIKKEFILAQVVKWYTRST